jgi:glycosyltransferase involved in cell wall biosynthesis
MSRIAIVVQRYGAEINGGSEQLARSIAQALRPYYEVDVLTSRALDYLTWEPHYPAGEDQLDGCRIIRFDHPVRQHGRDAHTPLGAKLRRMGTRWLRPGHLVARPTGNPRRDGLLRLRARGPAMDGLTDYLRLQGNSYASLIFFTAVYYPTAVGVLVHPERTILVPTLHHEKEMYLPHFHRVFRAPRWIMYLTRAEQAVAHRLYGQDLAPGEVCGVGIDLPEPPGDSPTERERWTATAARHGIDGAYLLYLGRIEPAKCGSLFEDFLRWNREQGRSLQLVAVGQAFMDLPRDPAIRYTGFVGTQERDDLIQHARAMVIPSPWESLSMALLESLARGCPVVVNGASEVLLQHVRDSGVGAAYQGYDEFKAALARVLARSEAQQATDAKQGRRYVEQHYGWPLVVEKFRRVIGS